MKAQCIESGVSGRFKPTVFDLLPQQFNAIEMRAVRRQEEQAQPAPFPLGLLFTHAFGAVNGCIVQHQHGLFVFVQVGQQSLNALDEVLGRHAVSAGKAPQAIVAPPEPQHAQTFLMRMRGQGQCFPTLLPQVRHARQERKTAFVSIQHINPARLFQNVQLGQSTLARRKATRRRDFRENAASAANAANAAIRATVFLEQAFNGIPMHFHAPFFSSSSTTALRLGVGLETAWST